MPWFPDTQSSARAALCRRETRMVLIILSFFGSLSFCHMFGNRKTNKGRKEIKEERETRSNALLLSFPTQGSWLYVHWRWSPMKRSAAETCWTVVDLAASASQPLPAAGTASMPPSGARRLESWFCSSYELPVLREHCTGHLQASPNKKMTGVILKHVFFE